MPGSDRAGYTRALCIAPDTDNVQIRWLLSSKYLPRVRVHQPVNTCVPVNKLCLSNVRMQQLLKALYSPNRNGEQQVYIASCLVCTYVQQKTQQ